jgi:hypothetical protein
MSTLHNYHLAITDDQGHTLAKTQFSATDPQQAARLVQQLRILLDEFHSRLIDIETLLKREEWEAQP